MAQIPGTIFIIDDDLNFRKSLSDILRVEGFNPIGFDRGENAIKAVESSPPEIALIDLKLAEASGLDVMGKIKSRSPDTECILLTGHSSRDSAIAALNLGAYSYILKPVEMDQLIQTVQRGMEKREALLELRRLKEFNEGILQSMSEGIAVEDSEGRLIFVNPSFTALLGYNNEEISGKTFLDLVPTSKRDIVSGKIHHADATHSGTFETSMETKDGEPIHVWVGRSLRRDGERIIGALSLISDITERKRVEMDLLRSESSYRSIFEGVQDAILVESLEGKIIDVNSWACEMFGWSREQFLTKSIYDLVPEGMEPLHPTKLAELSTPNKSIEAIHTRKDGEHFPVEISARLQTIAEETVLLVVVRDVTERKLSELALTESADRFRSVTRTAADAILITNHDGNILYWNQSAEKIFGYKEEEILGQSMTILMPKEYLAGYLEEIQRLDQLDFPDSVNLPDGLYAIRRSGEEFPVEISLAGWGSRDHRNYSAIIRDVTEKEQNRKQVEQRDRLAAVGQLAAGVAHDFNNILGTVILFSELLLTDAQEDTETHEMLTAIHEQAGRGAQLTSQILDFSRKSVIKKQPVDIVSSLSETRDLLMRTLPENILIDLSSSRKRFVIDADPTRLQQIIMNLAINARDAMSSGGELRFNIQQFESDKSDLPNPELSEGDWLCLQISDTGCGIPPNVMPHIFEPFFTTKSAGQGTGLGLAQVYGIIKQHGGHIQVESEEGNGTTFNIYFPLISLDAWVEEDGEIRHRIDGEGGSIMIVDDDPPMRKALEKILQSLNYKVVIAENGAQALEILKDAHGSIKLVLTDMVMPTMGGKELSQNMKEQFPEIKIVLMTGYPLGKGTRQLFDHSQMSWMQKPLTTAGVSKTLHEMLD